MATTKQNNVLVSKNIKRNASNNLTSAAIDDSMIHDAPANVEILSRVHDAQKSPQKRTVHTNALTGIPLYNTITALSNVLYPPPISQKKVIKDLSKISKRLQQSAPKRNTKIENVYDEISNFINDLSETPTVRKRKTSPELDYDYFMDSIQENLRKLQAATDANQEDLEEVLASCVTPQAGLEINHNIKWETGDKIVNGISNLFSSSNTPDISDLNTEYFSASNLDTEDWNCGPSDPNQPWYSKVFDLINNENALRTFTVVALITFLYRRSRLSKYFLFLALSMLAIKELTNIANTESPLLVEIITVWEHLDDQIDEEDEESFQMDAVEPQSFSDTTFKSFASLTTVLITALVGYKAKNKVSEALLGATRTSDTQTANVTLALLLVSKTLHHFFSKTLDMENISEYFYVESVTDDEVKEHLDKVSKFISLINAGSPSSYSYIVEVYDTYMNESRLLMKRVEKNSYDMKCLTASSNKLITLRQEVVNLRASLSGDRVEPVGILLKGLPGCFKSVLCARIGNVLAKHTIPEEWKDEYLTHPKDFHYAVPSDKFFDGYTNKAWVAYCDDIFQKRDIPGMEKSEAENVIKMVNTAPYPLPMAKVEAKNNVYFRSAFLIANTNLQNWGLIQSVNSSDAVKRRFNIELDISINVKYCKEDGITLNPSALPRVDLSDISDLLKECTDIPNDFWNIDMTFKTSNDSIIRKGLSIVDVVELAIQEHHERIKHFYMNKSSYERLSEDLSEELESRFANSNKYANLAKKTFTPQSGMPGGLYKTDPLEGTVISTLNHMSIVERSELELEFYDMCGSLRRLDLSKGGFNKAFLPFYNRCSDIDKNFYDTFIVSKEKRETKLFPFLYNTWRLLLTDKINPVTGAKEWFSEDNRNQIGNIIRRCRNLFTTVTSWIKNNLALFLIGAPTFTYVFYLLCKAFRKIIRSDKSSFQPQSVDYSRMTNRVGTHRGHELRLSKNSVLKLSPQSFNLKPLDYSKLPKLISEDFGEKNNCTDLMAKIFNKYMYIVYVIDNYGEHKVRRLGHCINIQGQIFAMPFHFIYSLINHAKKPEYEGAHVVLNTPTQSNRYNLTLEDFIKEFKTTESASDNDFCLVKVRGSQLASAGALSYFLKDEDVKRLNRTTSFSAVIGGTFQRDPNSVGLSIRTSHTYAKFRNEPIPVKADWDENNPYYCLDKTIEYKSTFSGGDCGTLLMTADAKFENRVIVGMHVAGDNDNGFSTMVTQESLIQLMKDTEYDDNICFVEEEQPEYYIEKINLEAQNSMIPVGSLTRQYTPGDMNWSSITRSKFHSKLIPPYNKVGTCPAKLRPFTNAEGEYIEPHKIALAKYDTHPVTIPIYIIDRAVESYEQLIIEHSRISKENRVVIPLKEALHSFGKVNPISLNTSSGFPMNISSMEDLKAEYKKALNSGDEETIQRAYERIADLVHLNVELYKKGIRPFFLYKDTLKDEKRLFAKMLAGNTRLFAGGPFILLCLFRMYFGAFMDMFVDANMNIGSAVGVNPYSTQWDSLARMMLRHCKTHDEKAFIFGDYSGFDTRIMVILMNAVLGIITRWYDNDSEQAILDNSIRTMLWMEITNSRHVFYGQVYEWNGRNPSGQAFTAQLNTLVNNILFRMAWQFAGNPIDEFNSNAVIIALGDDNGCGVSEKYRYNFNEQTMPYLMQLCGMKYTNEKKETSETVLRSITEVEFLKRSFKYDRSLGRWIAPIQMESITEMLNWTEKGKNGPQIAVDNILNALSEFSLHGKKVFDPWRSHLLDLKERYYSYINPHGTIPSTFESAFEKTLKIEYYY